MDCTLLIPGLFWPQETAQALCAGLELATFTKLVARGDKERFDPITVEGWLCNAFQIEQQQDWPIAPLTLALDGGETGGAYWLRADPVHIRVERDRLTLVESALFDLTPEEARALAAALDAHFSQEGVAFHAPHPKRWYVKLARPPKLVTRSVGEVAGQDVKRFLPAGEDALDWHRVFNEAQMLLHNHAVNTARDARGDPVVNSVWLWGGGTRPAVPGRHFQAVWSDDAAAVAIAAAADVHAAGLPADAESWLDAAHRRGGDESHLVVLDDLASAGAYGDVEGWRSRLSGLESHWFAPLARALAEKRLARLALVTPGAPGCWRFEISRASLLKFWRRAKAWPAYT